jgi:ABC-type transport system involved in cytochrome bd biosynthesis fused ATPase/permease subunit
MGSITLEMVSARGVWQNKPLKHVPINISVKSGDCLLLQGESGIGKSSIVYAIAGLIDYDGSIQLNGIEVRDIQVETLRDSMTVSMQDDHLFASSILENLRLANPSATFAEIVKALSAVELDHLIDVLPDGLDTHIGPFGQNFSGGELQRMRLARIFLRRTPLYILDEPLGHLDEDLAKRIIQRLLVHMTGATVVVISHEDIAGVENRFLIAPAV